MTTHDKNNRTENQVDAIAYIRVSTCRQVSSGLGLEAQREQLDLWATANGRTITAYSDLGVSGRNGKRVGLENAVAHACRLKCPLVVANLSRLARSTTDALKTTERLNRAGADLVLLKENIDSRSPCGKFMLTMLAAVASFEAELVGERTREANAVKRSRKENSAAQYRRDTKQSPNSTTAASQSSTTEVLRYLFLFDRKNSNMSSSKSPRSNRSA